MEKLVVAVAAEERLLARKDGRCQAQWYDREQRIKVEPMVG
jgi:hypothetical protein